MAEKTPLIDARVAEIYDLEEQIDALQEQRKQLTEELIEQGEGTYLESAEPDARKINVVVPTECSTKYDLYGAPFLKKFLAERETKKATPALTKEFRALQEKRAREILGEHFGTCFDRVVSYVPAKGYKDLIPRLFKTKTATAAKALLVCQVVTPPASAHIKLPDKPKKGSAGEEEEE